MGQWNRRFCNHWISQGALVQHIRTKAEDGCFDFACPVCAMKRCPRCANHATLHHKGRWCFVPPSQLRALLSHEQHGRILHLQEKAFRNASKDKIVQCPHPECDYFYVVEPDWRCGVLLHSHEPHGLGPFFVAASDLVAWKSDGS